MKYLLLIVLLLAGCSDKSFKAGNIVQHKFDKEKYIYIDEINNYNNRHEVVIISLKSGTKYIMNESEIEIVKSK
jgi:hypothetical protein